MKAVDPRHAGWISTIVSGTVTKWTVRGTTVPTLMLKLIELRDTFGALPERRTVVRIWVLCSVVSETEPPADPPAAVCDEDFDPAAPDSVADFEPAAPGFSSMV